MTHLKTEQEADLRRLLEHVPVARLSADKCSIGRNLAENLARDPPQVVPEAFTNESAGSPRRPARRSEREQASCSAAFKIQACVRSSSASSFDGLATDVEGVLAEPVPANGCADPGRAP